MSENSHREQHLAQQLGSRVAGGVGGGWRGVGGGLEGINLKTLESSEGKLSPFVVSIAQKKKIKSQLCSLAVSADSLTTSAPAFIYMFASSCDDIQKSKVTPQRRQSSNPQKVAIVYGLCSSPSRREQSPQHQFIKTLHRLNNENKKITTKSPLLCMTRDSQPALIQSTADLIDLISRSPEVS